MGLEEKVALVTGASRGIGRAIAVELGKSGCSVVVNYFGSQRHAEDVVQEITSQGGRAVAIKANVADPSEVDEMVKQTINLFGRIDILVNNAGITKDNLVMRMKDDDWSQVMDTNLKGAFLCSKAVVKPMLRQRSGRIINITSVVGLIGNAGQVNYAASKAGMIGLTKSLAKEVASRNITVNAVAPGYITTEMTEDLPEEVRGALLKQIPLERLGTPEDVAKMVKFFASDEASYITGQTITVDGGMVMY